QALAALNEVQRRYPESEYAADARLKIDLVNDHLAGKDMEIGRFYERTGQWLAAQIRFRNVVENFQTTSHAPEALYRLTETNLALGIPEEARKYAAVLGANYPGSVWYQRAFRLMRQEAPELAGGGGRTRQPKSGAVAAARRRRFTAAARDKVMKLAGEQRPIEADTGNAVVSPADLGVEGAFVELDDDRFADRQRFAA